MTEQELIEKNIKEYLARHQQKDLLRFLTAGSVDDGKSTLIGRLLYDSKTVYEDHLAALEKDSAREGNVGDGEIDYSLLLDGLTAEREQGITIDVAYRYFSTAKRKFIIADTPGHEQYTRNMATGASTADLAVILVDAANGVLPQTKRHSFISVLLSIKHIVVAINKMDLVQFKQETFEQICRDYTSFATKLQVNDVHFIPISALRGDNVIKRSENMAWYNGPTLLDYLENVHIASDRNFIDLRLPVQYVIRPHSNFRGYSGTVASGIIRKGDEISVLPSGIRSRVKSLVSYDGELEEAFPPMAITVELEDDVDVSRGDMIVHPNNVPALNNKFEAMIVWMAEKAMAPGRPYLIKHATGILSGRITDLRYKINVNTLRRESADQLTLNEIGRIRVLTNRPFAFDAYQRNRATGAFIVIDRITNGTVGAGMIVHQKSLKVEPDRSASDSRSLEKRRKSKITPQQRADRLGQKPFVVWLTGRPMSGKSSIAYELEQRLFAVGHVVHVLDSEFFKLGSGDDLGYVDSSEAEDIKKAIEITRLSFELGLITIVALESPFAEDRELGRTAVGTQNFLEIYVKGSSEDSRRISSIDDAESRSGDYSVEIEEADESVDDYEPPQDPALVINTSELDIATAARQIIEVAQKIGLLKTLK